MSLLSSSAIKARLVTQLFKNLVEMDYCDLTLTRLAEDASIDPIEARLAAGSLNALIVHHLTSTDDKALFALKTDFEAAGDAPLFDKLVEGLMHRFDAHAAHRLQLRKIHKACQRDPLLATRLLTQLHDMLDKLLYLCGDIVPSAARQCRLKALVMLVMRLMPVWLEDESEGFATTHKRIDEALRKGIGWARTFKILDD